MILNEKEKKVLRAIAKWYREGKNNIDRNTAITELEISDSEYNSIMLLMAENGVIDAMHGHPSDGPDYIALDFIPLCYSEQLVRQMEIEIESENKKSAISPDIVEQLKNRIRQNPWTAWPVIIFLALALLVPLINQLWDLIMKFVK